MARSQDTTMFAGHPTRPYHECSRAHGRGQGSMPMRVRRLPNSVYELQCGHVDGDGDADGDVCYGPCGAIQRGALAVIVDASGSPDAAPPREQRQLFLFAPEGFVQDDEGVWQQSEHAATNPHYGRRPTYRRPVRSSANGAVYAWNLVEEYPYDVRCPWCRNTRRLRDRDEVRLIAEK
jgi:hypothetical protein